MIAPDKIIRSSRRTIAVCIDNFGRVIVRAPKRVDEKRIYDFLAEKQAWIEEKRALKQSVACFLPSENLDGYQFLLLGKTCTIRLFDGKGIGFDEENHLLYVPRDRAKERLVKWLKDNAKRIFTQVTEQKAREMGLTYASVSVSSAKTRWGTCSADNKIRYTFRLLYAPKEVIEYVVVHELSHVRYKNHSALFWREVERFIPNWKERRKWLKDHGSLMEIF